MGLINNKKIITAAMVAGGAFDCQPYFPEADVRIPADLKCFVDNGAVNFACVMAIYPSKSKSETYYFYLN